jgi:hypothetical protein
MKRTAKGFENIAKTGLRSKQKGVETAQRQKRIRGFAASLWRCETPKQIEETDKQHAPQDCLPQGFLFHWRKRMRWTAQTLPYPH